MEVRPIERNASLSYDPALDGIRAIAVIAVVFFHNWESVFRGGWVGVDIFFVLSGYLITGILASELEARGSIRLKRFYLRRVLRLTPALVCLIVAVTAFDALIAHHPRQALLGAAAAASYTTNWWLAFGWSGSHLDHTWSLAIEEQFYLIWPWLLAPILRSGRPVRWISLIVAAAVAWRLALFFWGAPAVRLYAGFDTHADPLLMGCLLAIVGVDKLPRIPLIATALFAAAIAFLYWNGSIGVSIGFLGTGILGCLLIAAASAEGWMRRILSWPPIAFTGRISYGIYLWHFPIVIVGHYHVPHLLWPLLPLAAYGCAVASWFIVEKRILRLKDRLTN